MRLKHSYRQISMFYWCVTGLLAMGGIIGCKSETSNGVTGHNVAAGPNVMEPGGEIRLVSKAEYPKDQLNDPAITKVIGNGAIGQTHEHYAHGSVQALVARFRFASRDDAEKAFKNSQSRGRKPENFVLSGTEVLHFSGDKALAGTLRAKAAAR